jgi:hypothetical protein
VRAHEHNKTAYRKWSMTDTIHVFALVGKMSDGVLDKKLALSDSSASFFGGSVV